MSMESMDMGAMSSMASAAASSLMSASASAAATSMTMTMSGTTFLMDVLPSSTGASSAAAASASASSGMSHDMSGMSGMGDMDMSSSSCKVDMLWNWYTVDACFIARSWHITSPGMFAGSCIGVILLTMSLEFLRRFRRAYDGAIVRDFQRRYEPLPVATAAGAGGAVARARGEKGGEEDDDDVEDDADSATKRFPDVQASSSCCAPVEPAPARSGKGGVPAVLSALGGSGRGGSRGTGQVNAGGSNGNDGRRRMVTFRPKVWQQVIRALLHTAQFAVAYFVMLLAMYYNGYIIICILIGAFLGYFILEFRMAAGTDDEQDATGCCG